MANGLVVNATESGIVESATMSADIATPSTVAKIQMPNVGAMLLRSFKDAFRAVWEKIPQVQDGTWKYYVTVLVVFVLLLAFFWVWKNFIR